MIIDERFRIFLNSMDTPHTPFLEELYKKAVRDHVPVIRRELQSFLKTFLLILKPEKILEIGTAVGFSSILMAQYAPEPCSILSVESNAQRMREAEKNIREAGFADKIPLRFGDAADVLRELDGPYDLVFMDAAKGQYLHFLPEITRLLEKGGVLISDNVLQDGSLIESRFLIERRDRTIHKRMREYLYQLKHDPAFSTSILPVGDGITLSVRR